MPSGIGLYNNGKSKRLDNAKPIHKLIEIMENSLENTILTFNARKSMVEYKNHKGGSYSVSYRELKEHHERFVNMTDDDFLKNINDVIHLACIMCWFKEIPTMYCLCDVGIVHQLVHLLGGIEQTTTTLSDIRKDFETILKLD